MESGNDTYQALLTNSRFVAWALGEAPQDDGYWQTWQANDPGRRELVAQARLTLLTLRGRPVTLSDEHVAEQVEQALAEAKRQEGQTAQPPVVVRPLWQRPWLAAASVLVLLGIGWMSYTLTQNTRPNAYQQQVISAGQTALLQEVVNQSTSVRHVRLPDGSSVLLRANSRLSFPKQFAGARREVYLSGEAFFEVSKNPQQPFFVYADELVTKVLGTSFSVRAYPTDTDVKVVVKTGRVSVFARTDAEATRLRTNTELAGTLLLPNQQATFDRSQGEVVRTNLPKPALLDMPIEEQSFTYRATPVAEVLTDLEKAYGVDVVFDPNVLAQCSITATLGDEPLFKKLDWICAVLDASYTVNGDQIRITAKPCQ